MQKLGLIVLAVVLGVGGYYFLRTKPAFDLDRFDQQIFRLKAALLVVAKTADTDVISETIELDLAYLTAVEQILSEHIDDCAATVVTLEKRHEVYLAEQDEIDEPLTAESIGAMARIRKMQQGQRAVAHLGPAWIRLAPVVEEFAWSCKEESEILAKILGTEPGY